MELVHTYSTEGPLMYIYFKVKVRQMKAPQQLLNGSEVRIYYQPSNKGVLILWNTFMYSAFTLPYMLQITQSKHIFI